MTVVLNALLTATVAGSVMIAVVLAARALLGRRMHPVVPLLLWAMVLLRLLLPVTAESPVHVDGLFPKPVPAMQRNVPVQSPAVAGIPLAQGGPASQSGVYPAFTGPDATPTGIEASAQHSLPQALWQALKAVPPESWILAVWAAGALAALLAGFIRSLRFAARLRRCGFVQDEAVLCAVARHSAALGLRRPVPALACDFAPVPMVFGALRPRLLLPERFISNMDPKALDSILLHELCHIRRGDLIMNALWLAARALHWFNPLVWLAFRLRRDDAELRCDDMVACRLDRDGLLQYGQSLVDAARVARSGGQTMPSAAALLFSRKAKVFHRVTRLLKPSCRSRASASLCAALALVLAVSCFTTACQPTPTKAAVVGKGDGSLEEKLTETATPQPKPSDGAPEATAQPLRQRMGIPERLQAELADDDNTVRVHIDAPVDVPDAAAPVYNVEYAPFTEQQLESMWKTMLGGATVYEPFPLSRDEIGQQIVETKAELADAKERGDDEWKNKMELELESLQERYADAPDTVVPTPTELKLRSRDDGDGMGPYDELNVMTEVNGRRFSFYVSNGALYNHAELVEEKSGSMIGYNRQALASPEGVSVSRQDAQRQAETIAADLDGDLRIAASAVGVEPVPQGRQVWMFAFTRTAGGFPTPYDPRDVNDDIKSDAPFQPYERLWVMIDDGGLAGMQWYSQAKITGTVNADAALLPYAEIEAKAKEMLLSNSRGRFEGMKKVSKFLDVNVDRVTLGLMRVNVPDKPGKYLLIPVWDFFGKEIPDTSGYPEKKKKNMPDYENMPSSSLLTINAVDGSIIDRSKGY